MSLATIYTRALIGISAPLVTVEAHIRAGMPSFSIVGLPEAAVRESRDRVRSALLNTYFEFPIAKITINLAPADLPKNGSCFDLPIALSILAASQQIPTHSLSEYEFVGELALAGELRSVKGILPFALKTKNTSRKLILPKENAEEAALVSGLTVLPAHHITEVCAHLIGETRLLTPSLTVPIENSILSDMADIKGQSFAKRALEIAATGGHSILFIGPPGTGKTMLASRLPFILPPMTDEEALESAAITSISHSGFHIKNWKRRPFRAPHHSASPIALVGGGNPPRPGEISLAHHGILFLDEFPEFSRPVLEALREPMESGNITISRAAHQSEFPANFQLIATMNPCPCGYLGDPLGHCRCTLEQIQRYHLRISGPVFDRIDMHVEVPRIPIHILQKQNEPLIESSRLIRERITKAREQQISRAKKMNAQLTIQEIKQFCKLEKEEQSFLENVSRKLNLSARSYHRLLKLSLTIVDLKGEEKIKKTHLAEALTLRKLDRFWISNNH